MQTFESECAIKADHPSLAGHFPDNPIVPGVVILDCVLQALYEVLNEKGSVQVRDAKFISTLLPDEMMRTQFNMRNEMNVDFECRVEERLIAKGHLNLQRNPA